MSFYCRNLEEVIFSKHKLLVDEPDKMIIISGYLGPRPVRELAKLPFPVDVIGGMYPYGVASGLYGALKKCQDNNPNLNVYFTDFAIHSKIYIWLKKGEIKEVLIGSANFSDSGLRNDLKESLADMSSRDNHTLLDYYNLILQNSTKTPKILKAVDKADADTRVNINNADINKGALSVELPLYHLEHGRLCVPAMSGLNWGLADGHTSDGDAYVAIPKEVLGAIPDFFEPIDDNYRKKNKGKRNSEPIEIIWDDGTVMQASMEGVQKMEGVKYPKQISSYSDLPRRERVGSMKSILGRYLRKRLGVSLQHQITYEDLKKYGRTSITFVKASDGVYQADFSVK